MRGIGIGLAAVLAASAAQAAPGAWQVGQVVGSPGACSARLPGADIDLILMINNKGKLVLTAGHSSWNASGASTSSLSIDGGPATSFEVNGIGPLYMGLVPDAATARLRTASAIDWTLPPGTFHIVSRGLGQAMDETIACMRK